MSGCSKKIHFCSLSVANLVLFCIVIIRVEFQVRSFTEDRDQKSQNYHLQDMEPGRRNRRSLPTVQKNLTDVMNRVNEMEQTMKRLLESRTFQKVLPGTHQFILQGPPGVPGGPGARGRRGRTGRPGKRGPPGLRGLQGRMGKPGVAGPRGSPGPKGAVGPPGSPGVPGARGTPGESISPPRVIVSPQSLIVNEQQTVRLYCGASGNPKPQVSWMKVESSTNGKVIQMNKTKVEMIMNNVTFSDRGRYICTASNMIGTSQDSAVVLVRAPPRFRKALSSTSVGYLGLQTKLVCDIVGYPQPIITWRRSSQLPVSGPRFVVSRNMLTIRRTEKIDGGPYMCRGSNSLGTILELTTLEVKNVVPARIVDKPPSSILIKRLNDVVRLTCTADGSPTPTMHWEKNGHQVSQAEVKSMTGLGLVKSELILKHFTPNQSDVYSCVARNTPLRTVKTTTRVEMRLCADPGVPANGQRLGTRFLPGQSVSYVCNINYTLVGQDKLLCQPDGQWTQSRPSLTVEEDEDEEIPMPPLEGDDIDAEADVSAPAKKQKLNPDEPGTSHGNDNGHPSITSLADTLSKLQDPLTSSLLADVRSVTRGTVDPKICRETLATMAPEVEMACARTYGGHPAIQALHAELDTLPRCARHGTVQASHKDICLGRCIEQHQRYGFYRFIPDYYYGDIIVYHMIDLILSYDDMFHNYIHIV